ncbi:MAG TPA: hypothetical protein VGK74_22435 [Symbiobacteriaceae bacterium]|jgi:hypothetical protein
MVTTRPLAGLKDDDKFVTPTPAQLAAMTEAWDVLGVSQYRRDRYLASARLPEEWDAAIQTLAEKVAIRRRGLLIVELLQTAYARKARISLIGGRLYPGWDGEFKSLSDHQVREILRRIREA